MGWLSFTACGLIWVSSTSAQEHPTGYTDTPTLPGSRWKVHDDERPRPSVVQSGIDGSAPSDALVLFDGKNLNEWQSGDGKDAKWRLVNGAMEVNGTGSIRTRREFGDVQLHLEWASPKNVESNSQGRGNSGVFFLGRYEVQILDSYDNVSYADGQAAAMYGQHPPAVNVCRKPGEWQTFDILFEAPRFEGDSLQRPARATVIHNGVIVHHAREFLGLTTHRAIAQYQPHPVRGPLQLQDHGNPVRFRNVWIRELGSDR